MYLRKSNLCLSVKIYKNVPFKVNISNYNTAPSHSEAFSLLTQETPQWMSKRGTNQETPEWVDKDNGSGSATPNKLIPPQQNAPKVTASDL